MRTRLVLGLLLGLAGCDDATEPAAADAATPRAPRDAGESPIPVGEDPMPVDGDPDAALEPAPELDAGAEPEPDAAPPAPRPDGGMVCGEATLEAEAARRPVDILWIIDSSPSMDDEIAIIQAKLNLFTERIAASGLDFRVALVGAERDLQTPGRDYFGVCIPPPLSGADGCPDTDSDRYRHVRAPVHSSDGLDVTLGALDQLDGFLRPEARLHVVMVSDDDHRNDITLADLHAAGLGEDLIFHSIVTLLDYVGGCGVFDEEEECSCGDERGRNYIALTEGTDGLVLDLCSEDWDPLFDQLNEEVEANAGIPCTFELPELRGAVIDPQRVNVDFVAPDGARTPLFNVDDCAAHPEGWRFDDPVNPTRIELCPAACGDLDGTVQVELGCDIRKI